MSDGLEGLKMSSRNLSSKHHRSNANDESCLASYNYVSFAVIEVFGISSLPNITASQHIRSKWKKKPYAFAMHQTNRKARISAGHFYRAVVAL